MKASYRRLRGRCRSARTGQFISCRSRAAEQARLSRGFEDARCKYGINERTGDCLSLRDLPPRERRRMQKRRSRRSRR